MNELFDISLKKLDLEDNDLNCLPESIGNLVNLEELNLNVNDLNCLPESFGNLVNLKKLYLYYLNNK
jgi:Leucine-rich repeat (LRR) protein